MKKINICPPNLSDILVTELLKDVMGDKYIPQQTTNTYNNDTNTSIHTSKPNEPVINNNGSINIFILPHPYNNLDEETKVFSTNNYTNVGDAINSILGFIINTKPTQH